MNTSDSPLTRAEPVADPYEFTAEQNAIVAALGTKMQFVGLVVLALGVVAVLTGFSRSKYDARPILAGVLYALIGFWTSRAGSQFRSIADTRGHDVSHLMAALVDLRKLYTLQYWVCLIALIGAVVLLGSSALY
jgi:hypothetical protein